MSSLCEHTVARTPGMQRRFAIAAGRNVALQLLDVRPSSTLTGRPLYLPAALAMPSRWRSSMASRSHVATRARMVSLQLAGRRLRVTSWLAAMLRITRRPALQQTAVLRASLSKLVTIGRQTG